MSDKPLTKNDAGTYKFLGTVLIIQVLMLGLLGLSAVGLDIPFLRQVVGFIYLTFIPGIVILRILKLGKLGTVDTLLYAVGLSIAFIMFVGVIINMVYPHIGISKPISTYSLAITLAVTLLILTFVAYKRDGDFSFYEKVEWRRLISPAALFFILLPLLTILGTRVMNEYGTNLLLLVVIPLIALVPILIMFTKFVPENLYPLAVLTVALSLLYSQSLISQYLIGYDVHIEYYVANHVKINSLWDPTITYLYNTVPSIALLAPTYSIICGIDLTWVFKIIYPAVFSLVPVGIYQICYRQIGGKIAFLSAFFFMSIFTFFIEAVAIARQQIAELFLILIVLVLISKSVNLLARTALCLIFGAALIFSHYSVSYILIVFLIAALVILVVIRKLPARPGSTASILIPGSMQTPQAIPPPKREGKVLTIGLVAIYVVACLSWYMWSSGSLAFLSLVKLINHIVNDFFTEFLSIGSSQALSLITTSQESLVHETTKYLVILTTLLIIIGIIDLLLHWQQRKFDDDFIALSLISFVMLMVIVPVPYITNAVKTTRLHHISLLLLSPFCITGAMAIGRFFSKGKGTVQEAALKAVAVIFVVMVLFNTGFVHEVSRDHNFMGSLIQSSIRTYGNATEKATYYSAYTVEENVYSAIWLRKHVEDVNSIKVYTSFQAPSQVHSLDSYGMIPISRINQLYPTLQKIGPGDYIYLHYINVVEGVGIILLPPFFTKIDTYDIYEASPLLSKVNRIYASQGSEILLAP